MMLPDEQIVIQIICADPIDYLDRLTSAGVVMEQVDLVKDLVIEATVRARYVHALLADAEKSGASVKILKKNSILRTGVKLFKRPILFAAIFLLVMLTAVVPTRILFVEVQGNTLVPANQILEAAEECGIRFWSSRRAVRSEKMKNQLLSAIPQLQWAGINTRGCVAVISVREKPKEESEASLPGVSSIYAVRDGLIKSCTAGKGTLLCQPGDVVKKGQKLISAYTDCGFAIQATDAEGEIIARTQRVVSLISPAATLERSAPIEKSVRIGLRFGKKLFFFVKGSGISLSTCVKMYKESSVSLPGGYRLPLTLVTETCITHRTIPVMREPSDFVWLEDYARKHLRTQMHAGQILSENSIGWLEQDAYYWNGYFTCAESIGLRRSEEILPNHG